jgi:hypothetical protein
VHNMAGCLRFREVDLLYIYSIPKMLRRLLFLSICCIFSLANAQEHLGLKVGNYSGIHGIQLNPAANVNIPLNWDLNIVSAGIYGSSNYMFLQKGALIKVPFSGGILSDPSISSENEGKKALFYNFSRDYKKFYFHHTGMVMGPSFMYNIPDNSFGIYYGLRSFIATAPQKQCSLIVLRRVLWPGASWA